MTERPQNRHLRPARPGEVRNPRGVNQFSYRRDFERAIDELLKGTYEFRREPVSAGEAAKARCLLCNTGQCDVYVGHSLFGHGACIDQIQGLTRGQVIALVIVQRALAGDEKMLPVILDRLWPRTSKVELSPTEPRSHYFIPTVEEQEALLNECLALPVKETAAGLGRTSKDQS